MITKASLVQPELPTCQMSAWEQLTSKVAAAMAGAPYACPLASHQSSPRPSGHQLRPSVTKQGSAPFLGVQRGKSNPFGNITGGISSRVPEMLPFAPGRTVWIRWMATGAQEQASSQSPMVPGFSEELHDTSLELCEAKLPLSGQRLLHAHNSTARTARWARGRWRQSSAFSPLKQSPIFDCDKLRILPAMAHGIVTKVLTVSVEVAYMGIQFKKQNKPKKTHLFFF